MSAPLRLQFSSQPSTSDHVGAASAPVWQPTFGFEPHRRGFGSRQASASDGLQFLLQIRSGVGLRSSTAAANAISLEKPSASGAATASQRTLPWEFSFKYPLRSLWPGGRNRFEAIAVDDAVSVDQKEEDRNKSEVGELEEKRENDDDVYDDQRSNCSGEEACNVCNENDDYLLSAGSTSAVSLRLRLWRDSLRLRHGELLKITLLIDARDLCLHHQLLFIIGHPNDAMTPLVSDFGFEVVRCRLCFGVIKLDGVIRSDSRRSLGRLRFSEW